MESGIPSAVLVELIATTLTEAIRSSFQLDRDARDRDRFVRMVPANDPDLVEAIDQAVERLLNVDAIDDALGGERLRAFLTSVDCCRAILPLFAGPALGARPLELVREGFVALLVSHVGTDGKETRQLAARLFDVLVNGVAAALRVAAGRGKTAALNGLRALSDRMLADQLANLERNLMLLRRPNVPSHETIRAFSDEYRRQVLQREGSVLPPNFDRQQKRPLDALYVLPRIGAQSSRAIEGDDAYTYDEFLAMLDRCVVLGDPGGGKSTLTKRIATDVSAALPGSQLGTPAAAPTVAIRVILRSYGARKQQSACSLLAFAEEQASARYQMPDAPPGVFEYLLRNGHAVVLLDGLDELTATAHRREIAADVESFANLFPATPILVTSRTVGYDEAPLDAERFERFALAPFDEPQVREYAVKAFSLDEPEPLASDSPLVEAFMSESEAVADLRENAMLLGLMCNLYRGEGFIPANRPDVYEKCAVMLFERWDQQRGIRTPLPFESRLRPAMQYLAHWLYDTPRYEDGVTRVMLVARTTSYLHERRFPDLDEARAAAEEFVDLCRGRAWVFTDIGSQAHDEPRFGFTHRTFLEYFTAAYIVRTHPTPEALAEFMAPKVAKREWDVVLQLAAQIQSRNVEDASDTLVRLLLTAARGSRRANTIGFLCTLLRFIVPFPETTNAVVNAAADVVAEILTGSPWDAPHDVAAGIISGVEQIVGELVHAGPETRGLVAKALGAALADRAEATREPALIELATELDYWLRLTPPRDDAVWAEEARRTAERLLPLCRDLAEEDAPLAAELVLRGELDVEQFVARFPVHELFNGRIARFANQFRAPVLGTLLYAFADPTWPGLRPDAHLAAQFPRAAEVLRRATPPWYRPLNEIAIVAGFGPLSSSVEPSWTPDARFAAFAVLAMSAELEPESLRVRGDPPPAAGDVLAQIRYLVAGKAPTDEASLVELVDAPDVPFVRAWLDGEIQLTELPDGH